MESADSPLTFVAATSAPLKSSSLTACGLLLKAAYISAVLPFWEQSGCRGDTQRRAVGHVDAATVTGRAGPDTILSWGEAACPN